MTIARPDMNMEKYAELLKKFYPNTEINSGNGWMSMKGKKAYLKMTRSGGFDILKGHDPDWHLIRGWDDDVDIVGGLKLFEKIEGGE